jgi:hypothetical protein
MRTSIALCLVFAMLAAGGTASAIELEANPAKIELQGPGARFTLLVEGRSPDGRIVDLTAAAKFVSRSPKICVVSPIGEVQGLSDGAGAIDIETPHGKLSVPVTVAGTKEARPFNFENDIVPLMSKFACNSGGCHGKAEGQNGFKLSVFGFDPQADYDALTKEGRGRRVSVAFPLNSLLLTKPSGLAPHGGGIRIAPTSREFETLRAWIAAGLPMGNADDPKVVSIELTPRERVLDMRSKQRLRAVARYSDGHTADVTQLAKFQSNNDGLASVDETGLVTVDDVPGQVAIMASYMGAVDVFRAIVPRAEKIDRYPEVPEKNFIDRFVHDKLHKLNIVPSEPADDAEFLRRVTIDLTGTLPTADEARRFLSDKRPDARTRLVDELLERPEFAEYWALRWADLLRVERQALGHKGAYAYYDWIRQSVATNKPLDQFAREIITAEGPLSEAPPANLYKAVQKPGELANTISQVFLGVRIACAECHHHPADRWSQTDYYGMQAFFTQVNRKPSARGEIVFANGDPQTKHPRTGEVVVAHGLGEAMPESLPADDRRPILAAWLASPENPWFARHMANRVWAHFMGRGIVEPVDDVRATNPPSNPELLDALAAHLVESKFDLRALIRMITASAAYQRSSRPNPTNERDEQNYSRALFKRMDAEVLFDAVCQTTGIGEKFPGVPSGYRAIQLWDSKVGHYFLRLFGRPVRSTACECERNVEPSVAQVLHILNSPEIHTKLAHEGGQVGRMVAKLPDSNQLVEELYLTFYSRFPSADEQRVAVDYLKSAGAERRRATEDLAWSMLNSLEFMFNH